MKSSNIFYIIGLAIKYIIVVVFGTLWGIVLFVFKLLTFQIDWKEARREAERRKAIRKRQIKKQQQQHQPLVKQYHFSGTIFVKEEKRK